MSCSNIIPDSQIAINDVADFEKNAFIIKDELADHHFTADDIEIIIFKKNNMMCFRAPDTVSKIQRRMIMAKLNCEFEADGCNIETDEFLVTRVDFDDKKSSWREDYKRFINIVSNFAATEHDGSICTVSHFDQYEDDGISLMKPHVHIIYHSERINKLPDYIKKIG